MGMDMNGLKLSYIVQGFQFTHSSLSQDISVIRMKLDSKSLAGFILASEWKRLLETKVCERSKECV